jgi:hypothetical protein
LRAGAARSVAAPAARSRRACVVQRASRARVQRRCPLPVVPRCAACEGGVERTEVLRSRGHMCAGKAQPKPHATSLTTTSAGSGPKTLPSFQTHAPASLAARTCQPQGGAAGRRPSLAARWSIEPVGRRPRTLHRGQRQASTMQLTRSVGHGQWLQAVHARHPLPGLPIPHSKHLRVVLDVAPMATSQASSPKFIPVCGHGTASVRLPDCFDHLRGLGPTLWTFGNSSAWLSVCNPLTHTLHVVRLSPH